MILQMVSDCVVSTLMPIPEEPKELEVHLSFNAFDRPQSQAGLKTEFFEMFSKEAHCISKNRFEEKKMAITVHGLVHMPRKLYNLMKRDNCECQHCGVKVTHFVKNPAVSCSPYGELDVPVVPAAEGTYFTIDHVIPKAHGGPNRMFNYVFSCADCNTRKSDRVTDKDLEFIKGRYDDDVLYSLNSLSKRRLLKTDIPVLLTLA